MNAALSQLHRALSAAAELDERQKAEFLTHLVERIRQFEGAADAADPEVQRLRTEVETLRTQLAGRDNFITTVGHELKNPLTPVVYQIRLLMDRAERAVAGDEPLPPDWVHSQLAALDRRVRAVLDILDRLLDASRVGAGRIEIARQRVDLAEVAREVLMGLEPQIAMAECAVHLTEHAKAIGWWDRFRLDQVWRNLLTNAMRYGAGTPIEIHIDADDVLARFAVTDHGIGIRLEDQARIFERFEQLSPGRGSGGFGFGLWLTKRICHAMGGDVVVASRPGAGATFTVTLPRAERPQAPPPRAPRTSGG